LSASNLGKNCENPSGAVGKPHSHARQIRRQQNPDPCQPSTELDKPSDEFPGYGVVERRLAATSREEQPSATAQEAPSTLPFEVAIIGSGPSGLVSAKTLLADHRVNRIVVLSSFFATIEHLPRNCSTGNACPACTEKLREGAIHPLPSSAMQDTDDKYDELQITIPHGRGLDHILAVSNNYTLQFDPRVTVDFSNIDYRAFCLLLHKEHGAILLHCTRKKKKPPHFQLPGGHVDDVEFKQVCNNLSRTVTQEQLYLASRLGCAREVYEETGIDLRQQLDRLHPLILYRKPHNERLMNEFKHRLFFVCEVLDEDFVVATKVSISNLNS
jgi:8-oxo-dGTP pyrophosphatase MutT (NUDIX family)